MPLPLVSFVSFERALKEVTIYSETPNVALVCLVNALCDGAVEAVGYNNGQIPQPISASTWIHLKYCEEPIPFDNIEINTSSLLKWLLAVAKAQALQDRVGRTTEADSPALTELRGDGGKKVIGNVMAKIYRDLAEQGVKPPNVNELPEFVNAALKEQGRWATSTLIKQVGDDPRFKKMRLRPGHKLKDSKLKPLDRPETALKAASRNSQT